MLFGGYLSKENEVWLLNVDKTRVQKIEADGVMIRETDGDRVLYPHTVAEAICCERGIRNRP